MLVDLAVVSAAERDGELVADLAAKRAALGEAQMVGVAGLAAADQAGLPGDEADVIAVADAAGFGEGEGGLVDRRWPLRSSPPARLRRLDLRCGCCRGAGLLACA